jgi:hypothetical protein
MVIRSPCAIAGDDRSAPGGGIGLAGKRQSMMTYGLVHCDLDLSREGVTAGNLYLDHSDDANAAALIPVAIVSMRRSEGKTVRLALHWTGVWRGAFSAPRTRYVAPDPAGRLPAPRSGLFEPGFGSGQTVEAGGAAGWLHDVDEPAQPTRCSRRCIARRAPRGGGQVLAVRFGNSRRALQALGSAHMRRPAPPTQFLRGCAWTG